MAEIINDVQDYFNVVGLNHPATRFGLGFTLVTMGMEAAKPLFAYDAQGNRRPWVLFDPKNPSATAMPFLGPGVIAGGVLALFF